QFQWLSKSPGGSMQHECDADPRGFGGLSGALGINGARNESAHLTELPWAGFGMSIAPYLDDFGVDPETKRVLGVALEMTRVFPRACRRFRQRNHRQADHRTCQGRRA